MISSLFHAAIYNPLYNGLVFLIDIVPFGDVGLAVILLTIIVKLILFPLSKKAFKTQLVMRELEGSLRDLQEKHKDNKQKLGEEMMRLYRERGINPFSSIILLFLQLPVIFGLYLVFYNGGLPDIHTELLYPLIPSPLTVSMEFIGLIDMAGKSILLAFLAGATQYVQSKLSLPEPPKRDPQRASFQDDFSRSMHLQMRYVMPIVVGVFAYVFSAAVALYWTTSNIFTILQEWYIRRSHAPEHRERTKNI